MNLLITLITHNRLNYTKRTLGSLLDTIKVPNFIVIVDNASNDGTQEWLLEHEQHHGMTKVLLAKKNNYPGKATNDGWEVGLQLYPEATHLMRCDNDMEFADDWATKAEEYFKKMPPLGQLGLDYTALDSFNGDSRWVTTIGGKSINAWPGNVGGPCIIRREIYDKGARYDETPWQDLRKNKNEMITPQEDVKFSLSMHKYGYIYGHATEKLAWTFADKSTWQDYPDYYKKTFKERGYDDSLFGKL